MKIHDFDPNCPGCRPVVLGLDGKLLPPDNPLVQAMERAYASLTLEEKRSWHEVTCHNSRDPKHLAVAKRFMEKVQEEGDK